MTRDDEERRNEVEKLALDHFEGTCAFVRRLGADRHTAEDIVQEAFFLMYAKWETAHQFEVPRAYLSTVAARLWFRHNGREHRRPALEGRAVGRAGVVADFSAQHVGSLDLWAALDRLGELDRRLIVLTASGFRDSEIAELLDISLAMVRRRRRGARSLLEDLLRRNEEKDGT